MFRDFILKGNLRLKLEIGRDRSNRRSFPYSFLLPSLTSLPPCLTHVAASNHLLFCKFSFNLLESAVSPVIRVYGFLHILVLTPGTLFNKCNLQLSASSFLPPWVSKPRCMDECIRKLIRYQLARTNDKINVNARKCTDPIIQQWCESANYDCIEENALPMVVLLKFCELFCTTQHKTLQILIPFTSLSRFCHFESKPGFNSWDPSLPLRPKITKNNDLDNKPPNSFPPYNTAVKLKAAMASFGVVRYMVAYANHHAFTQVPQVVREQKRERKILNQLENMGVIKTVEPYLCQQIHEHEQIKRLNQIESARGKM
ncbi:hypothetical protein CFP56_017661 [Quercus suber]|uniref:Uncharacterized protein n=1 Tax=Quercus suber TaxID=58331 RepID=A0AAW0M0I8_QUESU